ncbi:mammalian cell entry protein [Mycolicibacterium wolinskyi]|uniref:Mammalian cell entry protein n=1 Tax=Mycolicibacterium wolinskyi TaxID=59750 RepID=A0A132PP80_9MYCO|nr:mammalian cell entry protein [Mycolicibacterium wolinskyi]KWX24148.1 mammalian cell entry protein [Mycolicibacterium wolinskyi]
MEDQPADPGDLTSDDQKPRRRWGFGRKRNAEQAAEETDRNEPSPEARPKRTPVGKGRRAAAVEPEVEREPEAEVEAEPEPEPEAEAADPEEPEPAAEEKPEPVLVPHRPAGKRLTHAAVGAAAVFVAAGAFAGAMVQPYLSDRALVDTKLQVAQTSADAITTLWTYTPDNIESLPDRASRYLSNDFANQYRQFIDSIVPSNKQAQITNNTQVVGTAVESISPTEATAIVYTNSVSTSPVTKNVPSLRYLSYRLTLVRDGGDWRITQMPALTQLDLSPQL